MVYLAQVLSRNSRGVAVIMLLRFTIYQVFADLSDALENTSPLTQRPKISFDPENGFVTYYEIKCHGNGIFTAVETSDCCRWYEFGEDESF
jgi:hypothetical protein